MALDWFTYRLLVFMKNGIGPKTEPWGSFSTALNAHDRSINSATHNLLQLTDSVVSFEHPETSELASYS